MIFPFKKAFFLIGFFAFILFGGVGFAWASNNDFIRAVVTVERFKGDKVKSVEEGFLPVVTDDSMGIRLFKANFDSNERIWKKGEEICSEGVARVLCPVYPYQVIYAESTVDAASNVDCFSWFINNDLALVPAKGTCPFENNSGCFEDTNTTSNGTFLFLNVNTFQDASISLLGKRCSDGGSQSISSTRKLFVDAISPVIINRANSDAEERILSEGDDLVGTRNFSVDDYGDRVVFGVDTTTEDDDSIVGLFPYYLDSNWVFNPTDYTLVNQKEGLVLYWQINGAKVDQLFISQTKDLYDVDINPDNGDISFNINMDSGSSVSLTAILKRTFLAGERETLVNSFGTISVYDSASRDQVDILVNENEEAEFSNITSFFASTFRNSPKYLVVVFRISLAMMAATLILIISSRVLKKNEK